VSDERSIGRFLRGLTIGALIGAVIAGSRLLGGRPSSSDPAPADRTKPRT
jgi:gas vesicle protein